MTWVSDDLLFLQRGLLVLILRVLQLHSRASSACNEATPSYELLLLEKHGSQLGGIEDFPGALELLRDELARPIGRRPARVRVFNRVIVCDDQVIVLGLIDGGPSDFQWIRICLLFRFRMSLECVIEVLLGVWRCRVRG